VSTVPEQPKPRRADIVFYERKPKLQPT
jgi:hypothetical protein